MKNRPPTLKLLLDTSFILPTLGIDTGEDTRQTLKKLANLKTEIHISRYTLLESLWVAAKLIKNQEFNSERFQLGLRSILETGRYTKVDENPQTFIQALRLYSLGHKDMVDNLLYTTSKTHSLKLLTLDTELKDFITHQGLKDTTIFPNQILQRKEHL